MKAIYWKIYNRATGDLVLTTARVPDVDGAVQGRAVVRFLPRDKYRVVRCTVRVRSAQDGIGVDSQAPTTTD